MKDAYTWGAILVIVLASSTGDVLLSRAMKQIGDVGKYSRRAGLLAVVGRVVRNPFFLLSASLTFVANAIAGKIFLHEQVDHRRWMAALMVAGGVALLAG